MDTHVSGEVDLSLMEAVYEKHKDEPGALIPVLQDVQALYGFLSREVLQSIADWLDVALGKVYSVATYYSEFHLRRRGPHVLRLCGGTVCRLEGSDDLFEAVKDTYGIGPGETTPDGELTVETVYCLGACARAPAAMLDGEVIGDVHRDVLLDDLESRLSGPPQTAPGDRPAGTAE